MDRVGTNKTKGFTVIEVLVAFSIMLFGFVAMLSLAAFAVKANTLGRGMGQARYIGEQRAEHIRALDYRHPILIDDGDTLDLEDTTNPDYRDSTLVRDTWYRVFWNIAEGAPAAEVKTVRIHVLWNVAGLQKQISFTTFKGTVRR